MDSPFIYDKFVTGKNFISRREDCIILENFLVQGEHIALYSPPKTGKMSVIQQTLFNMRISGKRFTVGQFSLFNIRSWQSFLLKYGAVVMRAVAQTPGEYARIVSEHLGGTRFVFDQDRYANYDEPVSVGWDLDESDVTAMLMLPFSLSRATGQKIILIMDEFETLAELDGGEEMFTAIENVIKQCRGEQPGCSFIFCGSRYNAMKDIFETRRFFYRLVEKFRMRNFDEKEIIDHVIRGFLSGGKVVDRELLMGMCRLFKNQMWYINHFVNICDGLSKGYIVEATLMEALGCLISVHEPRFMSIMSSLTLFQINFLQAVIEGNTRFASAPVRQKYNLSSSANVIRLKEALVRKEILTFDENDEPRVLDPLFEYWVKKYYFDVK